MKSIICFIDDSDFEHDLVHTEIAPFSPEFAFVSAYDFEETRSLLGSEVPALFLLDLWGQDGEVPGPCITDKEELLSSIEGFPTLDGVYSGLEDVEGDKTNEYLKRLFSIVNSWRNLFEKVCSRAGQNRKYGLHNLAQARLFYPGVPAVFYTRKSLMNDAVAMFRSHADGLFIKPTGGNDRETKKLTREYAPQLLKDLKGIILSAQT